MSKSDNLLSNEIRKWILTWLGGPKSMVETAGECADRRLSWDLKQTDLITVSARQRDYLGEDFINGRIPVSLIFQKFHWALSKEIVDGR